MTDDRASVIDHLRRVILELEADRPGARQHALEHLRAVQRLLGIADPAEPCNATSSAGDDHYRLHATFGHVCTALEGHDAPHLCSCGHTWTERL